MKSVNMKRQADEQVALDRMEAARIRLTKAMVAMLKKNRTTADEEEIEQANAEIYAASKDMRRINKEIREGKRS